ncbi:MAG TPA: alpha-D-glucose phosphate-specific phosphoglucomutase [Gammaproteobacteria bacterium]|nr:alpha-D-glucose phosphate-specific phosphoglucomutase [Gammaproteobacteria bacterium]
MPAPLDSINRIASRPFDDQKPGTAGLRKRVAVFQQPHYLENFLQAVFDCVPELDGSSLVVGGDGRYFNRQAINTLLRMAAANGVRHVILGRSGILSTPAASHLIRLRNTAGGFVLTASHNPGGPEGDFGIKFNVAGGGQASEQLTNAIHARSKTLSEYRILPPAPLNIDRIGSFDLEVTTIEIVDPVEDYAALMETLFDFDAIRALAGRGFRLRYDALHGVTGPYAQALLVERLGFPAESVVHAEPLSDFGGRHPDPNPHDAHELMALMNGRDAPDFGAASDGDGDRNMIVGPGMMVSPGDSLAVLAAQATRIPGYRDGLAGVARSMPTSRAIDKVAGSLGIPCFETPTGWRFFFNLLEAAKITLCGEESFGTSSNHCREKDGLWAVLFWLNLLAVTGKSVPDILDEHWRRYGRHYFERHDYKLEQRAGDEIMRGLQDSLPRLADEKPGGRQVMRADNFRYHDPVDGSESANQGVRIEFNSGERIVYRLSGTGTSGATLRVYLERFAPDGGNGENAHDALEDLAKVSRQVARLKEIARVDEPTAVT